MAPTISSLPSEVVEAIAALTEPKDLFSLRLASRGLNAKSFLTFSKTWFTTLFTDLTPRSMSRMVQISSSEVLSQRFHTLTLYLDDDDAGCLGDGFKWERQGCQHQGCNGRLRDVQKQPCVETLRHILCNAFKNCRSFVIYDFGSHGGGRMPDDDHSYLTAYDAIEIVLSTIAEAGLKPSSFAIPLEIFPVHECQAQKIDLARYRKQSFSDAWSSIRKLNLELGGWVSSEMFDLFLIHPFSNLQHLALACGDADEDDEMAYFHRWASSPNLPQNLQTFQLSTVYISANSLEKILRASRLTLNMLALRKLCMGGEQRSWQTLFINLRDHFHRLERIAIQDVTQWSEKAELEYLAFFSLSRLPQLPTFPVHDSERGQKSFHNIPCKGLSVDGGSCRNQDFLELIYKASLTRHDERENLKRDGKGQDWVEGIKYKGPRIKEVLDLLVQTMVGISKNRLELEAQYPFEDENDWYREIPGLGNPSGDTRHQD